MCVDKNVKLLQNVFSVRFKCSLKDTLIICIIIKQCKYYCVYLYTSTLVLYALCLMLLFIILHCYALSVPY